MLDMDIGSISFILDNIYRDEPILHEDLCDGEFFITIQLFDQYDKVRIINPPETRLIESQRKIKHKYENEIEKLKNDIQILKQANEDLQNQIIEKDNWISS